ncbi:TRAP transporter small permease [Alloalcanivorax sp. C16-1]|uniref:TRAP transporter small permease n=1 Tax=Alloalcanivorax sp. C16-1 TaxID=3390051 RepID=UPI003970FF8A
MKRLRHLVGQLNRLLLMIGGLALFALMVLTFADVTGRKFFHAIPGALEVSEMLMVLVLFSGLPVVSWRGEHVGLDVMNHFYRGRLDRISRFFADMVCTAALGFLGVACAGMAARTLQDGDVSTHLRLPIGWFISLMAVMLLIAALVSLIRGVLLLLDAAPGPGEEAS